jgi:hypothetical protein
VFESNARGCERRLLLLPAAVIAALVAAVTLLPTTAAAQAIYGSLTGTIADTSGGGVPGATVTIKNEETGLELSATTDSTGTYTIRNIAGGTYTLKATLQGFKEFVQTAIPITAGGIVRINGQLEIGALSESVTVTTEAVLLKTDKADVSVDLRPEDVTNLPLNQYRNYQYLLNLVPGATPPLFQNAQTDTPGRALSTNINGTNRNSNVTRIDGAASINVWLPHHAGYIAPAETIENVNISTNSFDAAQGLTGGAATAVQTKSGTNTFKGSSFFFRQQDELNARRGYFDPGKVDASTSIYGGTAGGPIQRNKLFYFGSWERNAERQGIFGRYNVPTAKMRNGDFSEVLALNSAFRIYDPATGTSDGRNRTFFENALIPANRISAISKNIQALYPEPNNAGTSNGLLENYVVPRKPKADRDNYDAKVNWNRSTSHQIWGKFSMMQASVFDLFYLPFEEAGGGDTRTLIFTGGHTWTLSPTLLLDGSIGVNGMQQDFRGPDYGTNYGTDVWGIPGLNGATAKGPGSFDLNRYSGMPQVETGLSVIGNNSTWTPVWRDERSYTVSTNLTKVAGRHDLRTGFDFIRLRLNHWQPESGGNPRGTLTFGGGVTGTPGYSSVGGWNGYAAFLLGQMSNYAKTTQYEELSGRENQYGVYVADRWQVNEKFTLNLGLRYEYYPLMSREDRGIELLDLPTYVVKLGGVGGNDKDLGIKVSKTLFAPRAGAAYRLNDNTVFRAGYGRTFTPLPWTRPMRGRFPLTIAHSDAGPNGFIPYGNVANGIGPAPAPDLSSGNLPLPRGVDMTTPDPNDSDRSATQSWNAVVERRLPLDIAVSVGYVGTRTDGQYATLNLNYADAGGNTQRKLFAQANTASINVFASSSKTRYHALQVAINRPYKNGLLLKGAYTLSKAQNQGDDDGAGYPWPQPSQFHRNFALAGFDRPHMLQVGFVYELPFAKNDTGAVATIIKDWQVNGIVSWLSGLPFSVGGDNGLLQQQGGMQTINVTGDPQPGFGEAGPNERWYDPAAFSQPGNAWGNSERNAFRGPGNYNLDFSIFRTIPFSHYRLEIRAESQNVLNHPQFGNPVTGFTDANFMRIRSYSAAREPRRIQLGVRFVF